MSKRQIQNSNLYVNADEVLTLIECMQTASNKTIVIETLQEVINTIHELKWIEINNET